jgi:hypothetical protein
MPGGRSTWGRWLRGKEGASEDRREEGGGFGPFESPTMEEKRFLIGSLTTDENVA